MLSAELLIDGIFKFLLIINLGIALTDFKFLSFCFTRPALYYWILVGLIACGTFIISTFSVNDKPTPHTMTRTLIWERISHTTKAFFLLVFSIVFIGSLNLYLHEALYDSNIIKSYIWLLSFSGIKESLPRIASIVIGSILLQALFVLKDFIKSSYLLIMIIRSLLLSERIPYLGKQPSPNFTETDCDVLIFSDLHITSFDPDTKTYKETIDEGRLGDREIRLMETFIKKTIEKARPKAVIVSGDITDIGSSSAWKRVKTIFSPENLDSPNLLYYFAPGNHDVNYKAVDDEHIAITSNSTQEIKLTNRSSYTPEETFEQISKISSQGNFTSEFPMFFTNTDLKLNILIFNSNCRGSSSPITGAIGFVGGKQIKKAERLLKNLKGPERTHGLLIVLHHHIIPILNSWLSVFTQCLDAHRIYTFAFKFKALAIIHGHSHMPYHVILNQRGHTLRIISCGSALYPAEGPCKDIVKTPSCMGLILKDGKIDDVIFFRNEEKNLTTFELQNEENQSI